MPIPEGPGPGGSLTAVRVFASNGTVPGAMFQSTLNEVAVRLSTVAQRFEAIKRLRILRLRLGNVIQQPGYKMFPKAYYEFFGDPRLSTVAASIGVSSIANNPIHLDIDWFGPPNPENWWLDPKDGPEWHETVVAGITNALEQSLGLKPSSPDFSTWDWGDGPGQSPFGDWRQDIQFCQPPSTAVVPAFVIVWEQHQSPPWDCQIAEGGNRLLIRSGANRHKGT